jgi:hypothetical protein
MAMMQMAEREEFMNRMQHAFQSKNSSSGNGSYDEEVFREVERHMYADSDSKRHPG